MQEPDYDEYGNDPEEWGDDWDGVSDDDNERHALVLVQGEQVKLGVRDRDGETVITLTAGEAQHMTAILGVATEYAKRDEERNYRQQRRAERDRERDRGMERDR
ncbi:hypothetical protein [Nocardia sp. alder85J]|uniref:hypothetical protein n=1 Tax=Nocardia sp. alder85J TaxID=2862949 RepID=UPI001CD6B415|nr:hypothetical protein [Nocardia sp. alder85J]MCX4093659.1 hypothetical protein [Nocardia sp. alder85J]